MYDNPVSLDDRTHKKANGAWVVLSCLNFFLCQDIAEIVDSSEDEEFVPPPPDDEEPESRFVLGRTLIQIFYQEGVGNSCNGPLRRTCRWVCPARMKIRVPL